MSKEMLHGLIEMISEKDIDVIYRVLVKFVPESEPEPDELLAIMDGRKDRAQNGTISHNAINWD